VAETARELIDEGTATFSSNSQLLSELGERLIATNQIALSELVKNAYDADANSCYIWLEDDGAELVVKDDGHGMTRDEFLNFWMTIATPNRTRNPESRRYNRPVTGSKGVGRFAVRNLGRYLELTTVAYYPGDDEYRRLTAEFDWEEFEEAEGLDDQEVDYEIEEATEEEEGAELRISKLQEDWSQNKLEEVADGCSILHRRRTKQQVLRYLMRQSKIQVFLSTLLPQDRSHQKRVQLTKYMNDMSQKLISR
jgi:hypothetical protein